MPVRALITTLAAAALSASASPAQVGVPGDGPGYAVLGDGARLNREVTGVVQQWVQGVPARPVDSFTYDGVGSREVPGEISMFLDPERNRGLVQASWTDEHGD